MYFAFAIVNGHLGPTIAPKVFTQDYRTSPAADYRHLFTNRELDILHLLRQGHTNWEIAGAHR
ncbi:MAG TPA: LuxR C-terminal-related transcriptional regulator [Candidatus Obscuribacterales bacterium]